MEPARARLAIGGDRRAAAACIHPQPGCVISVEAVAIRAIELGGA
jgi:hypothetical protein